MEAIQEEKKYYELGFRSSSGSYFTIRGSFTELEKNQCIDFHEGPSSQSKCISIHDEESLSKLNQ